MNKKWLTAIGALVLSAAVITGCSSNDDVAPPSEVEDEVVDEQVEEEEEHENGMEVENKELSKEEELQEAISADSGIERVMVQVVESDEQNRVNADIVLTEENEEDADEIADHYAEMIKEKYPDHYVDIIVAKGDMQLTQKTYE